MTIVAELKGFIRCLPAGYKLINAKGKKQQHTYGTIPC